MSAGRISLGVAAFSAVFAPLAVSAQSVIPVLAPGTRLQEVTLSAGVSYDSNVTGQSGAIQSPQRLTRSDEIFEPAINFNVVRPLGRETAYLQGSAGYNFYAHNSILNRENLDIRPGVLGQIGYCQVGVGGDYSRGQSDLNQLALDQTTGQPAIVQVQNTVQVEQIAANANCGRSFGLAPTASASETWTQNSSLVQSYLNARTFSGSAGLAYRRPTFGSVSLFGAFSKTNYPNRAGFPGIGAAGVSTSYQTVSGGVTYARAIGSRLQTNLSVSYTSVQSPGGAARNFSGLTYSGAVDYLLSTRLRLNATASRATVPSVRLNSSYALEDLYSVNASYQLGRRISLNGGASYGHNAYNGLLNPDPRIIDITDEKLYTVTGNVDYQFARHLTLGLNVQHIQRDANLPGFTYPETRAGLTVRATF